MAMMAIKAGTEATKTTSIALDIKELETLLLTSINTNNAINALKVELIKAKQEKLLAETTPIHLAKTEAATGTGKPMTQVAEASAKDTWDKELEAKAKELMKLIETNIQIEEKLANIRAKLEAELAEYLAPASTRSSESAKATITEMSPDLTKFIEEAVADLTNSTIILNLEALQEKLDACTQLIAAKPIIGAELCTKSGCSNLQQVLLTIFPRDISRDNTTTGGTRSHHLRDLEEKLLEYTESQAFIESIHKIYALLSTLRGTPRTLEHHRKEGKIAESDLESFEEIIKDGIQSLKNIDKIIKNEEIPLSLKNFFVAVKFQLLYYRFCALNEKLRELRVSKATLFATYYDRRRMLKEDGLDETQVEVLKHNFARDKANLDTLRTQEKYLHEETTALFSELNELTSKMQMHNNECLNPKRSHLSKFAMITYNAAQSGAGAGATVATAGAGRETPEIA